MGKYKSPYKNFEAHIYNEDTQSMRIEKVENIHADKLETEFDFYPLENAKKVVNESNGNVIYVYHVDLPAKVEAQKLKTLRKSVALMRIFDYDKEKPFDLFKFLPYAIIMMLVIFR